MRLCPFLALKVDEIVSMLTLIDYEIMPMFGIDSLRDRVHVDIDSYEIAYVLTLIVKRCLTD